MKDIETKIEEKALEIAKAIDNQNTEGACEVILKALQEAYEEGHIDGYGAWKGKDYAEETRTQTIQECIELVSKYIISGNYKGSVGNCADSMDFLLEEIRQALNKLKD